MMYFMWGFFLIFLSLFFLFLGLVKLILMNKSLIEIIIFSFNGVDLSLYLLIDWISMFFIFLVMFISAMVMFYSEGYMLSDKNGSKFIYLLLLFVGSMVLMILSPNMLMILLGWDGLGLVSYCLVIYYQSEGSNSAGMLTILVNRIGDVGMLLSLIFMVNFGSWSVYEYTLSDSMLHFMGLLMMLGAVTKSAQMPFSSWLPAAMAAPTPVSSLVHSSTLVTAGVYLIIRLSSFYDSGFLSLFLMYMSIMTMFMSGMGASFEMDVKKIIALSTLSQLGVMMMILSVGFYDLAFFHLLTHAMFKAMLFLCAGMIIHGMGGSQDIRSMGLIFNMSPLMGGLMCLSNFSLMGFPFLSGFYSKDIILEVMYIMNNSFIMLGFIMVATMMTVIYSMRLMYYTLWKGLLFSPFQSYYENKGMGFSIFLMGLFVVVLGCLLSWLMFPHPIFLFLLYQNKLINLLLVSMGIMAFMLMFKLYLKSGVLSGVNFFGSMWFLSYISGSFYFSMLNKSKFYFLGCDQGWIETMSAMGVNKFSSQGSSNLTFYYLGPLKMILFIFFYVFMFFMLL